MAITTTDDDVHKYISSIMEAIHKLPKKHKGGKSTKPKAQAINSGGGGGESIPNKGKGKGKGKGKNKGPPLPNGKGKGGKEKARVNPSQLPSPPHLSKKGKVKTKVPYLVVNPQEEQEGNPRVKQ